MSGNLDIQVKMTGMDCWAVKKPPTDTPHTLCIVNGKYRAKLYLWPTWVRAPTENKHMVLSRWNSTTLCCSSLETSKRLVGRHRNIEWLSKFTNWYLLENLSTNLRRCAIKTRFFCGIFGFLNMNRHIHSFVQKVMYIFEAWTLHSFSPRYVRRGLKQQERTKTTYR